VYSVKFEDILKVVGSNVTILKIDIEGYECKVGASPIIGGNTSLNGHYSVISVTCCFTIEHVQDLESGFQKKIEALVHLWLQLAFSIRRVHNNLY
jgi:hypothetical protein